MIELGSVIKDLRSELQAAIEAGEDEDLRFELGPIELEVSVAVERSGSGGGKVRFWVVDLGGERRKDASNTQRIKLSLTPRLAGTDRAPQIAGHAGADEE
ncbi:trypco2 family protein [Streptomyces humi]|uniref:trypco2 family protein n=1 Tax=Streptomyces humi TaxID=1428620 RepID=UPI0006287E07|nr:trypco2 family protein [Streptomyces humi]